MKSKHIVANKVDVVAHSMGGLVIRSFCQADPGACKKQIRKLITIDTPHFGTPAANFLLQVASGTPLNPPIPDKCGMILDEMAKRRMFYDRGAVDSLQEQSQELIQLGGEPRELLAHPVVGLTPDAQDGVDDGIRALWLGIRHLCERTYDTPSKVDPNLPAIFGDDRSDRIVPSRSQEAFFTKSTRIVGVDHLTVHKHSAVAEKVRALLEEDPMAMGSSFEKGKF
jgi:pimeloyl-ACP methyl ester carboxylesterase